MQCRQECGLINWRDIIWCYSMSKNKWIFISALFCSLLYCFELTLSLLFKLQQKQSSIQNWGHCVSSSETSFMLVLWSYADISSFPSEWKAPSLKLPPPLVCWSIVGSGSEHCIETSNNLRKLGLDCMLGVASLQLPQVPARYSRN